MTATIDQQILDSVRHQLRLDFARACTKFIEARRQQRTKDTPAHRAAVGERHARIDTVLDMYLLYLELEHSRVRPAEQLTLLWSPRRIGAGCVRRRARFPPERSRMTAAGQPGARTRGLGRPAALHIRALSKAPAAFGSTLAREHPVGHGGNGTSGSDRRRCPASATRGVGLLPRARRTARRPDRC
jgi:hypothetical protein